MATYVDEPRRPDRARRSRSTTRCSSSTASAPSSRPGRSREDAVVRTMATAGRAVAFSGLAVAIGLGALLLRARAVHPLAGRRRPARPARLARRRADAAAGAARRCSGTRARGRAGATSGGDGWEAVRPDVGSAGPGVPGRLGPRRAARPRAAVATALDVTPGLDRVDPRQVGVGPGLRAAPRAARAGRRHADPDRRRHGPAGGGPRRPDCAPRSQRSSTRSRPIPRCRSSRTASARPTSMRAAATHAWSSSAATTTASPETRRSWSGSATTLVPAARFPAGTVVVAGGAPPQGVDFVDAALRRVPVARRSPCSLLTFVDAAARLPLARAAAPGGRCSTCSRSPRLRPARRSSSSTGSAPASSGSSQSDAIEALGADRPLRAPLRPLDGLRGLPRDADARGWDARRRHERRRHHGPRPDRDGS